MYLLDPVQSHQSIRDWLKLYSKQSGTASISDGFQGMRFVEIADRRAIFRKERLKEFSRTPYYMKYQEQTCVDYRKSKKCMIRF